MTIIVALAMVGLFLATGPAATSSFALQRVAQANSIQATTTLPELSTGSNIGIVGDAPPDRQQVEPTIAIDPRNPSIIVAGAQDLRLVSAGEHRWHGFYRSTDGGQTWTNILLPGFPGDTSPEGLASPLQAWNATSDPVLTFDRNGNLYYVGLVLTIPVNSPFINTGLFVAKFTNDGATYFNANLISAGIFPDKPWIVADTTGGPFDGNVYVAYDANLTATSFFGTLFTRSTDGGNTWSAPFYTPADETGELAGMAIDSSGNVYVSADAFDAVTENFLGYIEVTKITNGGTTIAGTTRAVNPAFLIPSPLPGGNFRDFTIPQMAADQNGVYLVWDDFRTGNSNVFFTRSVDGGSTWSAPLMVNDVMTGQHFFPTIAASGGIISVAWYDSRLNVGTSMNAVDVFYAQSLDAGGTFSPNLRVTSTSFNPNIVLRTDPPCTFCAFMGDYIQIAASPATAQPIWSDNRNACDTFDPTFGCVDQDAFTATINKIGGPTLSSTSSTINCTPATITVNQATQCSATVTDTSATPTSPTGSVFFSSSSLGSFAPSPTCTLGPTSPSTSSCWLSYTPGPGTEGIQTVIGTYGGDSTHMGSSGPTSLQVTKRASSTSVSCSPSALRPKHSTTCQASVTDTSSGTPITPTGSVSWSSSGTGTFSPTSCIVSGNGSTATCTVTYTPSSGRASIQQITATYTGDTDHLSSSGSTTIAVA